MRNRTMDRETARKLYDVVRARAGVRGKDADKWTKQEQLWFDHHFDTMPGEYREFARLDWACRDQSNRDAAKCFGMSVDTYIRLSDVGGAPIAEECGKPESPLAAPNPGIPGNTYGIDIVDTYVTPS